MAICLVRLIPLQTDNFRFFLRQQMDKQQTSVCTIANSKQIKERFSQASVFCSPSEMVAYKYIHIYIQQYIHIKINGYIDIYVYMYLYIYIYISISINIYATVSMLQYNRIYIQNMETAASICFLQTENIKLEFVFLNWQMINRNRRLLFQQTCPSTV